MTDHALLNASCRVALAALLHDLGKFAERARIDEAEKSDAAGITQREINIQLYCPHFNGRYSHVHAAYSAIALDFLERHLPDLVGDEMFPFAAWRDKNADDSLINASAKHHRPDTFLQWIIATADRVASGFEREEFERYNAADEITETKKNHYTARQLTLFEQIRVRSTEPRERFHHRYPLQALSPKSIFPVEAKHYESDNNAKAQGEYRALWVQFTEALTQIPRAHRKSLPLWLDHFDSLWLCFTHAIPAATAFNVKPEVSLYDHSKTTASLATALWRYHHETNQCSVTARDALKQRSDWDEKKILLIQGDFFGIQEFIFAGGSETQRQAARLLRGRSFYVSLLMECAALRLLDALALPATSQVINAAGKFLLVAPNTEVTHSTLEQVRGELNKWFLEHTYGQAGIGIATTPAGCSEFLKGSADSSPFKNLMKQLFQELEDAKLQRFDLCGANPSPPVFADFLNKFDSTKGVCAVNGRSPATRSLESTKTTWVCDLAHDHIMTGKWLASHERILVTNEPLNQYTLLTPIFGYYISFADHEDVTGKFGPLAEKGKLIRAWDFSLPEDAETPLWNGYARRAINAYVARFGEVSNWDKERYQGIETDEDFDPHPNEMKTLNHLARDDWQPIDSDAGTTQFKGVEALITLKGDVDNLGSIFQNGLENPTFAKMAALSRQINAFFTVWLPYHCRKEFPSTYTVFAGGDDFLLIGPWYSMIRLAQQMRKEFARYVAGNTEIHFSAGLSMTKPGLPIRRLGSLAEDALEHAKTYCPYKSSVPPKNSVSCFGIPVTWNDFELLMERKNALRDLTTDLDLSTGYLYDLLRFTEMAAEQQARPENALWHPHFAYRTRRLIEANFRRGHDTQSTNRKYQEIQNQLAVEIANLGIEKHGEAYKIVLFSFLYQQRN